MTRFVDRKHGVSDWTLATSKLPAAARERVHGGSNDLNNVSTEIAMRIADAAWLATPAKR